MINILITSAGKRVLLTREFMIELKQVFNDDKVYTCDMNPMMSPAGVISDGCFRVPPCSSEDYIETLLTLCIEHRIGLIIPTIDTELAVLSANKDIFAKRGVRVVVPDYDFVMKCLDKRKTDKLFKQYIINTPAPRDKYHPEYPMFAKPYDGSRSENIHIIHKSEDLTSDILNDPKLLFMDNVNKEENKEFTVDMYYGRDNHVKSIVPRERIEVRDGEVSKGITRNNYMVDYLKERMEYIPGVVGSICVQLFYRKTDDDVLGIEINPRFGGGYPLSYCAGANFPRMIIEEYLMCKKLEYSDDWYDQTIMLRYDDEIIVYNDGEKQRRSVRFGRYAV